MAAKWTLVHRSRQMQCWLVIMKRPMVVVITLWRGRGGDGERPETNLGAAAISRVTANPSQEHTGKHTFGLGDCLCHCHCHCHCHRHCHCHCLSLCLCLCLCHCLGRKYLRHTLHIGNSQSSLFIKKQNWRNLSRNWFAICFWNWEPPLPILPINNRDWLDYCHLISCPTYSLRTKWPWWTICTVFGTFAIIDNRQRKKHNLSAGEGRQQQ